MFCASECPVPARPLYLWLLAFGRVAITLLLESLATYVESWRYCSLQTKLRGRIRMVLYLRRLAACPQRFSCADRSLCAGLHELHSTVPISVCPSDHAPLCVQRKRASRFAFAADHSVSGRQRCTVASAPSAVRVLLCSLGQYPGGARSHL